MGYTVTQKYTCGYLSCKSTRVVICHVKVHVELFVMLQYTCGYIPFERTRMLILPMSGQAWLTGLWQGSCGLLLTIQVWFTVQLQRTCG